MESQALNSVPGSEGHEVETYDRRVDPTHDRYPCSIVWGPLPLITWILPFIGHMGICDTQGRVHDFAGPYTIGVDGFMVSVTKYYQLDPEKLPLRTKPGSSAYAAWNDGIAEADYEYGQTMHNICCNNCHHHSAKALHNMGLSSYNMWSIWWEVMLKGKYTSWKGFLATYIPFLLILSVVLLFTLLL